MTIQGVVPDVPNKRLFLTHMVGCCPVCVGSGKVPRRDDGTRAKQIFLTCRACGGCNFFVCWLDGEEHYSYRSLLCASGRWHQDLNRPVPYGYYKAAQNYAA